MTKGSNFWVIGGEFGSMNFHKLVEGSAQVQGPFKTRKEAEDAWRVVSEENRHKAGVRFSIVEEPPASRPDRPQVGLKKTSKEQRGPIRSSGWGRTLFAGHVQAQAFGNKQPLRKVMVAARLTRG